MNTQDLNNTPPVEQQYVTYVDGGALKMALNVLRRAGKNEVADELEKTAVRSTPAEQQGEPEPVAWLTATGDVTRSRVLAEEHSAMDSGRQAPIPLYPHPPPAEQGEQEPAAYMRHRLMSNAGGFGGGVVCEFSEQPFNDDGGSDGIDALYVHPSPSPSLAALRAKVEALPLKVGSSPYSGWEIKAAVLAEIDKLGVKV